MATYYSPKISTENLVLYLDSGNSKSYIGSGTLWKDLSTSGKNGTMYGSPTFETDVVPCFNFSEATGTYSSDCNMGFTFSSNMVQTTGNFTFECWVKNPPAASGQTGMFTNAAGIDGYRFGVGQNGIYYLIGPNYTEGGITYSDSYNNAQWNHVVTTWDRTSGYKVNLYLNSKYQNYGSMPTTQSAFTNATPGLVRSPCCGIYTGKISVMKVYNKLLSDAEILQNYNAVKRRFGL